MNHIKTNTERTMIKTFAYHKPSGAAIEQIREIRSAFSTLHCYLNAYILDSREKSVAFTKLEEAAMWAIKAKVCNDPESTIED